jgi:predicted DNA-binding protein
MSANATISLRLPEGVRERLERLAVERRRSRSFLIVEAIERHLETEEKRLSAGGDRFSVARSLLSRARNGRERAAIDTDLQMLRDDD